MSKSETIMADFRRLKEEIDKEFNELNKDNPCPICGMCPKVEGDKVFVCKHVYTYLKCIAKESTEDLSLIGTKIQVIDHPWIQRTD